MKLVDRLNCTACGACNNACPSQAIRMIEDNRGFIYPEIDDDSCTNCGLCRRICPEINQQICKSDYDVKAYAAVNRLDDHLDKGSSGSVFMEIARVVLEKKGVVYGCAWDGIKKVRHISVSNTKDIEKILKSKYIQSEIGFIYRDIRDNLQKGKDVLFSGTPCQVAGLKSYLGKEYDGLICIDIVCHGVPNSKIFNDFIRVLEKEEKGIITSYCFRDKVQGIGSYVTSYTVDNKIKKKQWTLVSYGYLFMMNYLSRDSCYRCKYANEIRIGDITLGDFWGINHYDKSFDLERGVSAVIVSSDKGKRLFSTVKDCFLLKQIPYSEVYTHNDQLKQPARKPKEWECLWEEYEKDGYKAFHRFYNKKTIIIRTKAKLKLIILEVIKKIKYRNSGKRSN